MFSGDDYSKIQTFISQQTQGSRYSNCATHFLVWLIKQDLRTSKSYLEFPEHFVESHFFPDRRKKKTSYSMSTIRKARVLLVESKLIQTFYVKNKNTMFIHWNTHYYIINYKLLEQVLNRNVDKTYNQYCCEFDGLHKTWKDIKLNKEVQMKQTKLEIDSNNKDVKNLQKMNKALSKENEHLKAKIQKLEEKLKKAGKLPTIVKYTIDNYGPELEKEKEILNRFNVPIWSISELCKRLVKVLEGDNFQNPLMTKQRLNKYFDLILQFNLQEYRQIPYAPKIYSDAMLFEKYEQIVDCLQKIKPLKPKQQASDVEKKQKEYNEQYQEYLRKSKVLENTKIEDEEDEELDKSLFSDND